MPANTPNRAYPYSVPGDAAEVAPAIQALAEAIDQDLVTIAPTIRARRVARVSRSTPVSFGTIGTARNVEWDTLDVNVGGALTVFPTNPGATFQVTPAFPGYWIAVGEISYTPISSAFSPIVYATLDLNWSNVARFGRHTDTEATDVVGGGEARMLNVAGGRLMNGTTDYFHMVATILRNPAIPNAAYSMFGASMTLWQMTQS